MPVRSRTRVIATIVIAVDNSCGGRDATARKFREHQGDEKGSGGEAASWSRSAQSISMTSPPGAI